jgi:tetratricopeptide (TPR) repeat protein
MTGDEVSEFDSIWDEAKGYSGHGDYEKAIDIYKYILVRYADNPKAVEYANAYLGDVLLTSRQHLDLAETHLKKAITTAPDNHHYHYLLGFACSVGEQWPEATRALKKAIALSPGNSEYERCLGWAMFNGGDETEGLDHLNSALELAPADVHIMTDLGTAMLMVKDFAMARQYAKDALQIDPTYDLAKRLAETIERIERKPSS